MPGAWYARAMTGLPAVRTVAGSRRPETATPRRPGDAAVPGPSPDHPDLPPEMVAFFVQRLESGQPDEFGEVGRHVFIGAAQTWCHTRAPSVDAVCRSHRALGIDLDPRDVAEVQVLPDTGPEG